MALVQFAPMPRKHQLNPSLTVQEVKILQELVWVCEGYQYTEERTLDSLDYPAFWTVPPTQYEQGLGAAFFAEGVAEIALRMYAGLAGLGTFVRTQNIVFQSLDYRKALPQ